MKCDCEEKSKASLNTKMTFILIFQEELNLRNTHLKHLGNLHETLLESLFESCRIRERTWRDVLFSHFYVYLSL